MKNDELMERCDRRLAALEQMYPGTNRVFADRDGEWSLPSLRRDITLLNEPAGGEG